MVLSFELDKARKAKVHEEQAVQAHASVPSVMGSMCLVTRSRTGTGASAILCEAQRSVSQMVFPASDPTKLSGKALALNLVLSIIGTTILGIPAQLKRTGWILTPGLLLLGCGMIMEMAWAASKIMERSMAETGSEVTSFQDFAEAALGVWGRRVASVTSIGGNLGLLCNGLILESQNLQYVVPIQWKWLGEDPGYRWWSLFLTATTLFYCFVDTAKVLQAAGMIAPLVCIICVSLAVAGGGMAIAEQGEIPESCQWESETPFWWWGPNTNADSVWSIVFNFAGVGSYCCFCFAVCSMLPPLRTQMQDPEMMLPAVRCSFTFCTCLFILIMVTGYLGFGNLGPDNMILGMRASRPAGWWATERPWETGQTTVIGQVYAWTIIVNLLLSDAIYVPCTINSFEGLAPLFFDDHKIARVLLRLALTAVRLFVATSITSFIYLTNLTSACFVVTNNILIPVLGLHRTQAYPIGPKRKAAHACIAVFGFCVLVLGSYGAILNMIAADSTPPAAGTYPRPGISDRCKEAYAGAAGGETIFG